MSLTNTTNIRLTEYAHGAGCGCKIAPAVLKDILGNNLLQAENKNLLVGNNTNDDAAVYDLGNGKALIATTDFFMPIVDDAFEFGKIAAANAISDVYAMGGTPMLALAILGWPVNKLSPALAQRVMEGAKAVCLEAGIPIAGGHSIDSPEPIFGLSVNGTLEIKHLKKNNTAQEGDLLFLTKPIGSGILSTAQKRQVLEENDKKILIDQLCRLNSVGEKLGKVTGVTAMTDVTGFGLLGHLIEMAEGSDLTAELNYDCIPKIPSLKNYIAKNTIPDATYRNWNAAQLKINFGEGVDIAEAFMVLPDPQTNGGLLFSVNPNNVNEVKQLLSDNGLSSFSEPIGKMLKKGEKVVQVKK
jgi:selenide, water dikinase